MMWKDDKYKDIKKRFFDDVIRSLCIERVLIQITLKDVKETIDEFFESLERKQFSTPDPNIDNPK